MAQGEVRVDVRAGLDKLGGDISNAAKEFKRLESVFNAQVKAISATQKELKKMRTELEAYSSIRAEDLPSFKQMEKDLKNINAETKAVENANKELIKSYEDALNKLEAMQELGFKAEQLQPYIAEVNRLSEAFIPIDNQLKEIDNRAKAIEDSMEAVRLDPSTSTEAENLRIKITETEEALESQKIQANETRQAVADLMAIDSSPFVQSIRQIQSEAEGITLAIAKQRQEFAILSELYDKAEQDLSAAKISGDALAESLAQANLDKIVADIQKMDARIKNLYYEAEKLKIEFDAISLDPANIDDATQMGAKLSEMTFIIDNAVSEAKQLSTTLNETFDVRTIEPLNENINKTSNNTNRLRSIVDFTDSAFKKLGATIKGIIAGAAGMFALGRNTRTAGNHARHAAGGFSKLLSRMKAMVLTVAVFGVIRKALNALRDNMGALLKANAEFAASWNAIKVNMLTAFAPIWEAIQPALISFMGVLAQVTQHLAVFIAMLTGKTYQQAKDSAEAMYDQANAMKEVGKASKNAGANLQSFDQINQAAQETAAAGVDTGLDFAVVTEPIDIGWMDDVVEKIKLIGEVFRLAWETEGSEVLKAIHRTLNNIWDVIKLIAQDWFNVWIGGKGQELIETFLRLFSNILNIIGDIAKSFLNVWESWNIGKLVVESIFDMLTSILNLLNSIAEAFRRAWTESGLGESIIRNIMQIITNINNIIGNFADKLREAWGANDNGIRIWEAILSIVDSFLGFINRITYSTSEWIKTLNLEPLVNGFTKLLEIIKLIIDSLLGNFAWAWENVILPFGKWLLEIAIPVGLDILINVLEWIKDNGNLIAATIAIIAAQFIALKLAMNFADLIMLIYQNLTLIGGITFIALGAGIAAFVMLNDLSPQLTLALTLLAGAFTALGVAMTLGFGPVGWIVGIIAGIASAITALVVSINKDFIPEVQRFGDEISQSTKNMLSPIIDNADEARKKLTELFLTSKPIVAEDTAEIAGYFKDMADTAISELEKMKNAAVENLAAIFGEEAINYEKRIAEANKSYDAMIAEIERKDKALEDSVRRAKVQFGEESNEYKNAVIEFEKHNSDKIASIDKINAARDEELQHIKKTAEDGLNTYIENKDKILEQYNEKEKGIMDSYQKLLDEQKKYLEEGGSIDDQAYKDMLAAAEQFYSDIIDGTIKNDSEKISLRKTRNDDLLGIDTLHTDEIIKNANREYEETKRIAKERKDAIYEQAALLRKEGTEEAIKMADEIEKVADWEYQASVEIARNKKRDIVRNMQDMGTDIIDAQAKMNRTFEQKWKDFWTGIGDWFKNLWSGITDWFGNVWDRITGKTGAPVDTGRSRGVGSYETGLDYVPYDEFPAILHKGERVLTASENIAYSNPAVMSAMDNFTIAPQVTRTLVQQGARQAQQQSLDDASINRIVNGIAQSVALTLLPILRNAENAENQEAKADMILDGVTFGELILRHVLNAADRKGIPLRAGIV